MRLNFFLLTHALDYIQKGGSKKSLSSFTKKILSSDNKNVNEIVKQANSCCSKQDLQLLSYKQFFLRNEFEMRRVIEWRLSKYIKEEDKICTLLRRIKESTPEAFKRHLITLLNDDESEISPKALEKELKRQEEHLKLYQAQGDRGPTSVSGV